jgi:hypothetical protein
MSVKITVGTTSHEDCGSASLRGGSATLPTWTMTTVGMRSNGQPIKDETTFTGTSFLHCVTIDKQGADAGTYTTVVTYAGVGDDYPSAVVGVGWWALGRDDKIETSQ